MDYTMIGLSDAPLLTIQIDAAINPGNPGGPVFNEQLMVCGVAFAGMSDANGVGYVIPVSVVQLFLESFGETGRFEGVPSLGVQIQPSENPFMKAKYGIGDSR